MTWYVGGVYLADDDDDDDDDNGDNDDPTPLFEQIVDPGGVQGGRHLRLTLLSRKLSSNHHHLC